eukprot:CAMPEP_0195104954 /NCGR_PEP_ID=MMETSP0448-20130528/74405_1 /TAXON_ID=66468 /ORGANISM="Heterocapsa triquestra, Strain CCMP 448" /LENGTH=69 /DNA_ID=CAMNT_0040140893 /DNA_START=98 /DNA_END=307 /DNA_ORIENTATION=+
MTADVRYKYGLSGPGIDGEGGGPCRKPCVFYFRLSKRARAHSCPQCHQDCGECQRHAQEAELARRLERR